MVKRTFDIVISLIGVILLSPFFIIISFLIILESRGGILFIQERVGKDGAPFNLFKFRTMSSGSDSKGSLTIGDRDLRVTRVGYYLRRFKFDELPQLFNVLIGDMSLVGPRPELRKYVDSYNTDQKRVLSVKPGITDIASIEFRNESELLAKASDPEHFYINEIMPKKLSLNLEYIDNMSFPGDLKIIYNTLFAIFK